MQTETNSGNHKEYVGWCVIQDTFLRDFICIFFLVIHISSVFSFEKKRRAEKRKEKEHKLVISYNIEMVHYNG